MEPHVDGGGHRDGASDAGTGTDAGQFFIVVVVEWIHVVSWKRHPFPHK